MYSHKDWPLLSTPPLAGGNIFSNECFLLPQRQYQGSNREELRLIKPSHPQNQATHLDSGEATSRGYKPEGMRGAWGRPWSFLCDWGERRGAVKWGPRPGDKGEKIEPLSSAELHTFSMRPLTLESQGRCRYWDGGDGNKCCTCGSDSSSVARKGQKTQVRMREDSPGCPGFPPSPRECSHCSWAKSASGTQTLQNSLNLCFPPNVFSFHL